MVERGEKWGVNVGPGWIDLPWNTHLDFFITPMFIPHSGLSVTPHLTTSTKKILHVFNIRDLRITSDDS